jgi:putative phage-type endonuclease
MIVHQLVQGTPEWHAYRAEKFNASDAPAMLGLSKYKTRTELLNERKTGLTADVDSATQKLFDNGHKFEALARPLAEEIIGEELSPVTGSKGNLSASFDGLTFMGDIAFEHKTLNDEIRACNTVEQLAMMYRVQMQQQLMVSGAEKCLFLATSWNAANQLIESKHFWFEGDKDIELMIVEGWGQFQIDLDAHVPTVSIEQPKAQAIIALPALFIQAKGEITTNNMKEYGEALAKRLNDVRSIALVTDQDFADAKSAAKHLRDGIEQAKLSKDAMLSQTVTIGEAAKMIDAWCEDMRITALKLEKDVIAQDLVKKQAMIQSAQIAFTNLVNALEKDTAPIRLNLSMPNFAEAIKGKSRYDKMQDAISTLVANSTIAANQVANDVLSKQAWFKEYAAGYEMLFADMQSIIFKATDDFDLLVKSRIETHKKAEAEREARIKANAEAAALAKVEAERVAKEKAEQADVLAAANEKSQKVAFSEVIKTGSSALLTTVDEAGTVKISPVELRAVVVEKQDAISSFLKSRNISEAKYNEYRAVIVEFVKYQASSDLDKAA